MLEGTRETLRSGETLSARHSRDLSAPETAYRHSAGNDEPREAGLVIPAAKYLVESLPGNPLLARLLLDHLARAGARSAEPGEFTARAYFNGRLDLAEAEGVAATIAASNERELSAG